MSKKSNVNPDHYKIAGRGRPSEIARDRKSRDQAGEGAPGKPKTKVGGPKQKRKS